MSSKVYDVTHKTTIHSKLMSNTVLFCRGFDVYNNKPPSLFCVVDISVNMAGLWICSGPPGGVKNAESFLLFSRNREEEEESNG